MACKKHQTNLEHLITDTLISLIQLGLHGTSNNKVQIATRVSWPEVLKMASMQGVSAICLDGMQQLTEQPALDKALKLQWIGGVLKQEQAWQQQWRMAQQLAALYAANGIGTYVMKGFSLSRLYPQPAHRPCTDMDCFLLAQDGTCAYGAGNDIAAHNGLKVDCGYYKHSKILLRGLTVENHQYLLPVKGSGKAKRFERELRSWIDNGHNAHIGETELKATSPFFDAVFVLAHAQEHFLTEGIILRHICDWAMVLKAHGSTVNWQEWKKVCQTYGLLSFGYAMSRLAQRICGVDIPFDCPNNDDADRRLLNDTLYRQPGCDRQASDFKVRVALIRNMMRDSWKYRLFSDTNSLLFCTRRVWGYLFDKDLD